MESPGTGTRHGFNYSPVSPNVMRSITGTGRPDHWCYALDTQHPGTNTTHWNGAVLPPTSDTTVTYAVYQVKHLHEVAGPDMSTHLCCLQLLPAPGVYFSVRRGDSWRRGSCRFSRNDDNNNNVKDFLFSCACTDGQFCG